MSWVYFISRCADHTVDPHIALEFAEIRRAVRMNDKDALERCLQDCI